MTHRRNDSEMPCCCDRHCDQPHYPWVGGMDQVMYEFLQSRMKMGFVEFPDDRYVVLVDAGQAAALMATPEGADVLRREFEKILKRLPHRSNPRVEE